jgi:hypothetical protein
MEPVVHVILWIIAIYLSIGLTATIFGIYFIAKGLLSCRNKKQS